jgi:hypothetical protein
MTLEICACFILGQNVIIHWHAPNLNTCELHQMSASFVVSNADVLSFDVSNLPRLVYPSPPAFTSQCSSLGSCPLIFIEQFPPHSLHPSFHRSVFASKCSPLRGGGRHWQLRWCALSSLTSKKTYLFARHSS